MARLLLHSVTVPVPPVFRLLFMLIVAPPSITGLAFDGSTYGADNAHDSHNKLLFNPYNQYTVDQLLIKMPSVLEEPEPADSEISAKILEAPKKEEANQNVFKLHLKSLLDSISFNSSKLSTEKPTKLSHDDNSTAIHSDDLESELFGEHLSSTTESLFENHHDNTSSLNYSKLKPDDHRKRQQEVNQLAQSRYKSVKHILSQIHFNCTGREEGYYADPDFDCHIFHYCKENGFKFTFICPANSIFSQEELQCDSVPVNSKNLCRSSENYYFINSLVYKNNSSKVSLNHRQNYERISDILTKNHLDLFKTTNDNKVSKDSHDNEDTSGHNDFERTSESISKFFLSNSKWNGIELSPPPKKTQKDSVIYTPKGDLPGFRPIFSTTQAPLVQQIDTPRWFPPLNSTSDILNKFDKNGFNVYNSNKDPVQTSVTTQATPNRTNDTLNVTSVEQSQKQNKYSTVSIKSPDKRPSLKVKGKPPKRSKIPNHHGSTVKQHPVKHVPYEATTRRPFHIKMKPAYSIQWDDDTEVPMNDLVVNRRHQPSSSVVAHLEPDYGERKPASSNLQQITVRPNSRPNNDDNQFIFSQKPIDPNFNPLLMESTDFSPIEFDEIFNKIPLRPLQTSNMAGSPEQAYHHMMDHIRQRPPPTVLAALARDQLKPLRMMLNNFLVTGNGNSIAKRQFLITPPQRRPFVPDIGGDKNSNKLVKRSDRFIFGPPIPDYRTTFKTKPGRKFINKLRRLWRPIARRLNL